MRIMRLKEVIDCTGLGRSSIYNFVSEGTFPKSIPLGGRAVGWLESEVNDWIMMKIEERDASQKIATYSTLRVGLDVLFIAAKYEKG